MVSDEMVEAAAESIFKHWWFQDDKPGHPVAWVPGGNSTKQDEARAYARAALEAVAPMTRADTLEEAAKVADRAAQAQWVRAAAHRAGAPPQPLSRWHDIAGHELYMVADAIRAMKEPT